MYLFIYDDFVKKYPKKLNNIEILLNNLNLKGKILYLESIKNLKETLAGEIESGQKNIIAVGNNQTIFKIINSSLDKYLSEKGLTLGIIPVGDNNSIAHSAGIDNELEACQIILARRIEKLDLGMINDLYFLANISIKNQETEISIQDFNIKTPRKCSLSIINLKDEQTSLAKSSPMDGLLDLYIDGGRNKLGFFSAKELKIEEKDIKLTIDRTQELESPAHIKISPYKINLIVGKNRLFN